MTSLTLTKSQTEAIPTFLKARKFAFFIHCRHHYNTDMGLYWKPLRKVPNAVYRQVFTSLNAPSVKWSNIYLGDSQDESNYMGRIEGVLLTGKDLLALGPQKVHKRIDCIIDKLYLKGYQNIGLGGITSPMTRGGEMLKHRKDVSVTNGNAFTAACHYKAIVKLHQATPDFIEHHTIVGATGSVGSCLAKMLVKNNYCDTLQLVARDFTKLENLKKELKNISPSVNIEISNKIESIKKSTLITLLTASAENLISAPMLKPYAVIIDGTQPRNTSPEITTHRPDVTIIDGGIVSIPGITIKNGGFALPPHHYFACFAETLLWAMEGQFDHFSIGNPLVEQAEYMGRLAKKYKSLGFDLANFLSFGKPLTNSVYAQ